MYEKLLLPVLFLCILRIIGFATVLILMLYPTIPRQEITQNIYSIFFQQELKTSVFLCTLIEEFRRKMT